jgi:hypothetical protein
VCNAWNHPRNCRCGWGGDGHLGTHGYQQRQPAPAPSAKQQGFRSLHSYTTPNARCPVCSKWAYFYQSPYGGRVFFDELGGDWPKHPCTDTKSRSRGHSTAYSIRVTHAPRIASEQGWTAMPMVRIEVHAFAKYAKVRAQINEQELELWTSCCDLQEGAPHFFKDLGNGVYTGQSILVSRDGTTTVIGYTAYLRQMDFETSRKGAKTVQVIRKTTRIDTGLNRLKRPNRTQQPARPMKMGSKNAIPKTALALAFERAGGPQL